VFQAGISPGDKNGIDKILELGSAALIKPGGAYGTRHPVWVLGRGLRVPLFGAGGPGCAALGAGLGDGGRRPRLLHNLGLTYQFQVPSAFQRLGRGGSIPRRTKR
jgi:hypothetical protein